VSLNDLELLVHHGRETLVLDSDDNRDLGWVPAPELFPALDTLGRRQNAISR
jgi:hypothetical protein